MTDFNKSIGKKMQNLRSAVGLKQSDVAKLLDIPRTAISLLECGERDLSVYEFNMLCKLYRISPNEILGWNRSKAKVESND